MILDIFTRFYFYVIKLKSDTENGLIVLKFFDIQAFTIGYEWLCLQSNAV